MQMAKRKKKKFQKKQFIALFESKNYQKVISKAKQFQIEELEEDELHTILTTSYYNLAQNNADMGDIARAVRDINSLLQIDDSPKYKLVKLKYLCYMEYFKDAIVLGEELIALNRLKKIQKEAIFLYLMAKLYSGDYALESKQLKLIPISRQRYILGFKALLEDDKVLALDYFNKCNPRAKLEKENIKAIIAILLAEEIHVHEWVKPLYQFLITGEGAHVVNSKGFREINKEVKKDFNRVNKSSEMKNLLALKKAIPVETIIKNTQSRVQESRLIYNNIVLLVDKREYKDALRIFLKYKNMLIGVVESALLIIDIKNHIEDRKSDTLITTFFSSYLKQHHKKLAPHQLDFIFLFLVQQGDVKRSIELAKVYHRDNFVFFLKELPLMREFKPYYQIAFNKALKKYSRFTNTLLKFTSEHIESVDEELYELNKEEERNFLNHIFILMILLQNLDNPHKKYKDTIFNLLKVLALIIQSFSYKEQESHYLKLSDIINKYIKYFKVDRFNLSADIKALFVSISKKKSVKKDDIYDRDIDENNYFYLAKKFFFEEEEKDKYNFNETEYDISIIKPQCILALERGDSEPFKILKELDGFNYYGFKIPLILELLLKVVALKLNTYNAIEKMLFYLKVDLSISPNRDSLPSDINQHAQTDIETAMILLEYALLTTKPKDMEYAWYLKWIDRYLILVNDYKLEKGTLFYNSIDLFLRVQEKKKFKSLNAKYKKIKKLKDRKTKR
jgi:hypothetical protein